jgi:bifunctional non-homologous end joining protein LigD
MHSSDVKVFTRNGLNWTKRFPTLVRELKALSADNAWIDGELVLLNTSGASDFSALQDALSQGKDGDLIFFAFDLPWLNGQDLRRDPLLDRKKRLRTLILRGDKPVFEHIRYSDEFEVEGKDFLQAACGLSLEGIISKKKTAPYKSDRTKSWIKSKCQLREEFVIGGFTDSAAGIGIGSLLLGHHEGNTAELHHDGRVGTGFTQALSVSLRRRLEKLEIKERPFASIGRVDRRGARWVRPELVAEIRYGSRTADGHIRHASFLGLREDKPAAQVRGEKAVATAQDPVAAGVHISHPGRVIDPSTGTTKLQLAQYYDLVAERLLREIGDRPVSLVRCPEGISGGHFFQRHPAQGMEGKVSSINESESHDAERLICLTNKTELINAVQFGALEIHPWGANIANLDIADRIVFDLDPDENLPFEVVVEAAKLVRKTLEDLGLETFAKTTGGKGLHVVVPLNPGAPWDVVKGFSRAVAVSLSREVPEAFIATMSKLRRRNKIYLDYLRNDRSSTAIAAYAARARPGLAVAWPVAWSDVNGTLDPKEFAISTITPEMLKPDPWRELRSVKQRLTVAILKTMKVKR